MEWRLLLLVSSAFPLEFQYSPRNVITAMGHPMWFQVYSKVNEHEPIVNIDDNQM